ncbi:MAG: TVP38/TMEM64 family protein [Thermodesulfobacteriota bacterium]
MITTIKGMNKKKLLMIIGLAVILVAAFFLVRESGIEFKNLTPSKIREYLLSFGMVKGALVYLAIYTFSIRPFVPIPPTLYTFAGGFTFGPIWGTVLTVTGATLNASLCFLLARALGKGFVEKISKGKFNKLNEKLKDSGFKTLLIIRTSPLGPPFDFVSYASGVLRIPFWSHFVATMVGVIPAVTVYSYFGGSITKGSLTILIAFFLVVVISILVPWYIKRRKRQSQIQ